MPSRALLAALAIAVAFLPACDRAEKGAGEAWVSTPALALEKVSAKPVFYSAAARRWLVTKRADLLEADDQGKESARGDTFAQAAQDPKLFRQLDRQQRFQTLLLVGDPSESRPLLEHLLETRDWKLVYLDHTSLVYRRDTAEAAWKPEQIESLRSRLGAVGTKVRARVLGDLATKLVSVRERDIAKGIIDEALKADEGVPEAWNAQANYRMALGKWKEAIESCEHALTIDQKYLPALGCMAQCYFSSKKFAEAYAVSSRLVELLPDNPGILFYHAKIAHEAKKQLDEIRVLKKLIGMAEKAHRPTSTYRVYLGQAYATSGEGEQGLAEFETALKDPELPLDHRKFANECVARLKDMIGKKEKAAEAKPLAPAP